MATIGAVQREVVSVLTNNDHAGYWRMIAKPHGGAPKDVTWLRGAPVTVGDFSFDDPFGAAAMTLVLPQVTIVDRLGYGELDWLDKFVDVDVLWTGALPASYPQPGPLKPGQAPWTWEGYIISFGRDTEGGLTVQMKGAGRQLDNFLAKPEYPARPLPYEYAICRQFDTKIRPSLRLTPMQVLWPTWWTKKYQPPSAAAIQPSYMTPLSVRAGMNWTGMVTRSTGSNVNVGDFFLFSLPTSGAFISVIELTSATGYHLDNTMLIDPNDIGPIPQPNQTVMVPPNSPRVLVACGTLPPTGPGETISSTSNYVTREQYWALQGDSYSIVPGETRTISFTVTSGKQETSSEQATVAASVGTSAGGANE